MTECSSGFGQELVKAVLGKLNKVFATAHNTQTLETFTSETTNNILLLQLNVTKPEQLLRCVEKAINHRIE
ncbi:MAG TPA: hypothetical protein DIU05_10610 [Bacteroidetes bacterium]|nr:hypothetical protein [Bacteroidota bacterium]